ncbi:DUF262 domain-containing protein [Bacillus cereus]|uniref:DUF262 domain-containing protein n=1 Tax=unclassified Bacillus cereus group TaxID=2750818 RepID=UPI001F5A1ED6|nr:DUF262 domain-containing protein [Bacillus cereus group sp. TH243-1LC]MDA1564348.1 DUF262 domain-containing protein [Bacillus cereus group sp. TH243-1LC]MDA1926404.1 DUF262 domain-containing protein [Bacillus cereus]
MKIKYQRPLISVQDAVGFIDKGEKYIRNTTDNLTDEELIEVLQGIILSPDYQRQYRSTLQEESSIIESLLLDIPIPEIFLVRTSDKGIQLRHVMDGQHRLAAIYRYVKDKFALRNLDLIEDEDRYINKKFSELDKLDKIKILGSHLSILEFFPFEDDETEIELFKRYNRNTKPLEKHEMAMATYYSKSSQYISNFFNMITDEKELATMSETEKLKAEELVRIYNVTADRKNKQKNHQELCILLSILEYGPDLKAKDGVELSTNYLKRKAKLFKVNETEQLEDLKMQLKGFNELILKLSKYVEYPLSSSIYKDFEKRTAKFHVGVSMVIAFVNYYFDINLEDENLLDDIKDIIENSPLGDIEYNASSTNTRNIMYYLSCKNNVFNKNYTALTFKEDIVLPNVNRN